jgi:hypothetical protein
VRCELPSLVSNLLWACHPDRDIDTCSSKGFQPTIISREELTIALKDANGRDIMWADAPAPKFRCQIIDGGSILKSGSYTCLAESYALGIQELYAPPLFLNQRI